MSSPVWKLSGSRADLVVPRATAAIDLAKPSQGVCQITWNQRSLEHCELLGITVDDAACGTPPRPADAYIRGNDLIAVYEPTDLRPLNVHVCWRWLGTLGQFADSLGFELQVSAQTELLDVLPERFTRTRLPSGEVGRLARAPQATWQWTPGKSAARATTAQDPQELVLVRPTGIDWSYLELVDPRNAAGQRVALLAGKNQGLEIAERLFPGHLEKGVILRSRVRGWFLPRSADEEAAAIADLHLVAAELPLTA